MAHCEGLQAEQGQQGEQLAWGVTPPMQHGGTQRPVYAVHSEGWLSWVGMQPMQPMQPMQQGTEPQAQQQQVPTPQGSSMRQGAPPASVQGGSSSRQGATAQL